MTEKTMLDTFNLVDEFGNENQMQIVNEQGIHQNFYVHIPWDEVREKLLQAEGINNQTKSWISDVLEEHGEKINEEISQQLENLDTVDLDTWQEIVINVLKFYFDNQDTIELLVDLIKVIKKFL